MPRAKIIAASTTNLRLSFRIFFIVVSSIFHSLKLKPETGNYQRFFCKRGLAYRLLQIYMLSFFRTKHKEFEIDYYI